MEYMMIQTRKVLAQAVAAALAGNCMALLAPHVAFAQQAAAEASKGSSILEEVVVTAQRRTQVLQDVPIAVQVVNNDLINDVGAENMSDLNGFVPGLVVSGDSPTQPKYQIRGIQTSDFGVGTDSAVGVYVDGVYAARTGASLLMFNDIERIEVLKGPQGTLFGRNSAAGAVSIVTRKPADDLDASLGLKLGNYGKERVEGMVNVPLGDTVALRVNGVWNKSDGWVKDAATGKDLQPEDEWSTRAQLRWDVTDDTQVNLAWNHDELNQKARPAYGLIPLGPDDVRTPYPPDPSTYLDPLKLHDKVYNDVVHNEESRSLDDVSLFIDHSFGDVDFRSTTNWRTFDTVNREDEDGTNRIALYFDTANIEHNTSWYQEFKFSGKTGAFDWVGGLSYYSEDAKQASDTHAYTDSIDTVLYNLGLAGTPDGTLFGFTSDVLAANDIPLTMRGLPWREVMNNEGKFQATALFGDVIWHATDRMNLTVGLRYTHDQKEFTWLNGPRQAPELDATVAALQQAGFFEAFPIPPEAYNFDLVFAFPPINGQVIEGQKVRLKDSWDDLSPRFVIDYKITPDVMVFGSLAKGYKAGGYNSVQPLSKFQNEDVWNVEAGVKSLFADIGVIVNSSVFYYQYLNKQAITLVTAENGVGQYVIDTSDTEAYGLDVDARWQPVNALTFSANLEYIDVTYKKYTSPSGINLSGQPTGEPKLSAALGGSYVWTLGAAGKLDLSAMYAYRGQSRCNADSQFQGNCQVSPNFKVGEATNLADLRLAWSSDGSRFGVALYVDNVFDDRYVTGVNNLTTNTFGTPFASVSAPRTYGVEFKVGL
jgi:iron complex outermembrane receptor protein